MILEIGMYVRSKINGLISKITDIEEICIRDPKMLEPYRREIRYILNNDFNKGFCETEKDSVKASHNIIDLIEVGDYVNGDKVIYTNDGYIEVGEENDNIGFTSDKFIKSIVTKEMFESMSYRLGSGE